MHLNSFNTLEEARRSTTGYNSHATREALTDAVKVAFNQNTPRDFQLDVAEALILGLDATVIAGMGSGKTLPWAMPLLLDENRERACLVISPLKALQADHARFFSMLGLPAAAINNDTWSDPVIKHDVIEGKYRILLMSPEMCFQSPDFSKLLRNPTWAECLMYVVIDECHCVTQWGKKFRMMYSNVDRLRSFVAPSIPFLATSATLPPTSFAEICQLLEISTSSAFHLNLGNDRSNLTPILWPLKAAAKDLNSLNFIVSGRGDLPRVVVYVNTKELARIGCEHLRTKVAPEQRSQVDFIHASRSKWPQMKILELFQNGDINILFATEVVGMGTDLKNVTLVVQFMVPDTLSIWIQRAGRAGRSGAPAAAVLLYEPSVIQKIKGKEADESDGEGDDLGEQLWEGDDFKKKNVESSLRSYVLTNQCRRVVTDEYFGTPARKTEAYSVPCCDNCMRKENPENSFSDVTEFLKFTLLSLKANESTPADPMTDDGAKATKGAGPRREERRAECRDFLEKWRIDCWLKNHRDEVWGPEVLLSDKVLTKLAATASLQTTEDIRDEVEGWWLWEVYAQEVLDGLKAIDARFEAVKAAKEADRLEQQRIERERRAAIASAERQRMLEEKERKRILKEAAAQEAKRQKEVKRQREEVKRQKEEQREEAKRQRDEAKQQKEEAKRQREEAKRQREEAKRQREEAKRQREEAKRQREGERAEAEAGRQRRTRRKTTTHKPHLIHPHLLDHALRSPCTV